MINKEEFEKRTKRFVDAGYMRELYKNDFLAVYNFGEAVYLACPYFTVGNGHAFGMIMSAKLIQEVINDNLILSELYKVYCADGTINSRIIGLNDRTFNVCPEGIKALQKQYKNTMIDYEFEKALNDYQNKAKGL